MTSRDQLAQRWRDGGRQHATSLRAYLDRLHAPDATIEELDALVPHDPRADDDELVGSVLGLLREANRDGSVEAFRAEFPPSMSPMHSLLQTNGQDAAPLVWLPDGRLTARVTAPGATEPRQTRIAAIRPTGEVEWLPEEIRLIGRSPDGRYRAVAMNDGIYIEAAWGETVRRLDWPTRRDLGARVDGPVAPDEFHLGELIVYPDGQRVIAVGEGLLGVIGADGTRLLGEPIAPEEMVGEDELDDYRHDWSMPHAAISPDGRYIAAGHQSSVHLIHDAATLEVIARLSPGSEYPHRTQFSSNGRVVAANSCHFYNGATVTAPVERLEDEAARVIDSHARVYCMIARNDEFIFGDAYGYLTCVSITGERRWYHWLGSSFSSLELSPDGARLAASTYAGQVVIFQLDALAAGDEPDPFVTGTSPHREIGRWLFWRGEPQPLQW